MSRAHKSVLQTLRLDSPEVGPSDESKDTHRLTLRFEAVVHHEFFLILS